MANNENTVQIQVEVLRAQLDKLIADINSLKNQKISVKVDTAGAAALEQLSDAVQQMRTDLQELDAQLGQNAAAFSGIRLGLLLENGAVIATVTHLSACRSCLSSP